MPVRNNKPVILIADDEPNILKFLAYNVKALGYDTVEVQDGTACIKKIKSNEITGLLLDINMPRLCPKSKLSASSRVMAEQLTATNGPSLRGPW